MGGQEPSSFKPYPTLICCQITFPAKDSTPSPSQGWLNLAMEPLL